MLASAGECENYMYCYWNFRGVMKEWVHTSQKQISTLVNETIWEILHTIKVLHSVEKY